MKELTRATFDSICPTAQPVSILNFSQLRYVIQRRSELPDQSFHGRAVAKLQLYIIHQRCFFQPLPKRENANIYMKLQKSMSHSLLNCQEPGKCVFPM